MKINSAISAFLAHCQFEKKLSAKTISSYQTDLKQFVLFLTDGNHPQQLQKIDHFVLKKYLSELWKFKTKTVKRKIASTKAFFNFLDFEERILINPFRKIKIKIREPFVLPVVMSLDEIRAILNVAYQSIRNEKDHFRFSYYERIRDTTVLELLFATGARVSELVNLKNEHVDMEQGFLKITGKGNKERIIQVCDSETLEIMAKLNFERRKRSDNHGFYFTNRFNNKLSDQSIRNMVKRYAKKAGITQKHITPHIFRHSFATLLLEEDVDIKYIQHMLGHSSIATTQIYTHVNSEKQKQILQNRHPRRFFRMSEQSQN